jgi:hypothetical protein
MSSLSSPTCSPSIAALLVIFGPDTAPDLTDPAIRAFLWHNIWWIIGTTGTLIGMGWIVGRFVYTSLLKETQFRLSAYEKDLKAANEKLEHASRDVETVHRKRQNEIEQGVRVEKQKNAMQTVAVMLQILLLLVMGFSVYLQTHWTLVPAKTAEQKENPPVTPPPSQLMPASHNTKPNLPNPQNKKPTHPKSSAQTLPKSGEAPATTKEVPAEETQRPQ